MQSNNDNNKRVQFVDAQNMNHLSLPQKEKKLKQQNGQNMQQMNAENISNGKVTIHLGQLNQESRLNFSDEVSSILNLIDSKQNQRLQKIQTILKQHNKEDHNFIESMREIKESLILSQQMNTDQLKQQENIVKQINQSSISNNISPLEDNKQRQSIHTKYNYSQANNQSKNKSRYNNQENIMPDNSYHQSTQQSNLSNLQNQQNQYNLSNQQNLQKQQNQYNQSDQYHYNQEDFISQQQQQQQQQQQSQQYQQQQQQSQQQYQQQESKVLNEQMIKQYLEMIGIYSSNSNINVTFSKKKVENFNEELVDGFYFKVSKSGRINYQFYIYQIEDINEIEYNPVLISNQVISANDSKDFEQLSSFFSILSFSAIQLLGFFQNFFQYVLADQI